MVPTGVNEIRKSIRLFLTGVIVWVIVWVILVISPVHASTEGQKCTPAGGGMGNFTLTKPPVPVPKAAFIDGSGRQRRLFEFRGKGVVLNFWATWCAPCIREMPALDRLQVELADDGVQVVTLSEDRGGSEVVKRFFGKIQIGNLPGFIDVRSRVLRAFGVVGLPTTILIDHGGMEIGRVVGAAEWDTADTVEFLKQCLAENPPS